jgi:succinate dehydrogenase / fumarate reductase flavoprotein subunit
MYEKIVDEDPYVTPMIYPAVHYTMGGTWLIINYNSWMFSIESLISLITNRLGASALMQGLADGYFVLPYTIGDYLAQILKQVKSQQTYLNL